MTSASENDVFTMSRSPTVVKLNGMPAYEVFGKFYDAVMGDRARAGCSVKQAAFALGYRQCSTFVKMFRRTFGTTTKVWTQ